MKKILLFLLSLTLSFLGIFLFVHFQLLASWHLKFSNFLYNQASHHTGDVVVVKIDPQSLLPQDQGGLGRWQDWQRSYYATVISNLRTAGAKVIGLDIFFNEGTQEKSSQLLSSFQKEFGKYHIATQDISDFAAEDDHVFQDSVVGHSDIVLAAMPSSKVDVPLLPLPSLSGATVASVALQEDSDNVIRHIPTLVQRDGIPYAFALAIVKKFLSIPETTLQTDNHILTLLDQTQKDLSSGKNFGPIALPLGEDNTYMTNFFGTAFSIPSISFIDAYHNNFDPNLVKNNIILIGEMDAGLHDDVYVPNTFTEPMPGVEVHANAIETILTNSALQTAPPWVTWCSIAILILISSCLVYFLRPYVYLPLLMLLLFAYMALSYYVFQQGYILQLLYPPLSIFIAWISTTAIKRFSLEKEKRFAIDAFSHYVSDKVVGSLIAHPKLLELGGEKKDITICFTDIANFTTISEDTHPEELSEFLHDYFSIMSEHILSYGGTLDKYIGDAIMCFFGAPVAVEHHEAKACATILAMHKSLKTIRARWNHHPQLRHVSIRSGVATGEVAVGNFGSQKRFDYTAIGDKVNLASRLEGINKAYSTEICIDESTYLSIKDTFTCRRVDRIRVKGKQQPVWIYELQGTKEETVEEQNIIFEKALNLYFEAKFIDAQKALESYQKQYPHDPVPGAFLNRIASMPKEGLDNWDGVYTFTSK